VLVVPLKTTSIDGWLSKESKILEMEETSPTLTAWIQILFLPCSTGGSEGQKPTRYLTFFAYPLLRHILNK